MNMSEEKITLSLEPQKNEEEQIEETPVVEPQLTDDNLSEEEKRTVEEFAKQIDITSNHIVLQYGSQAQQKIADFSDNALENVRTKDLGKVGDALTDLIVELKGFSVDEEEDKGFFGFFKKAGSKIENLKLKYNHAEVNVEKICEILEQHQIVLLKDIALLDQLYEKNLINFKELSMYILAGKKKLEEVQKTELVTLQEKAKATGLPEDAQAANDLANAINRFEKKIHDLELTRMVSIQMAPQIRLVQNNDTLMTEKIQSTLVNTIPLWKTQMVLALGVSHSQQAMEAQREVTNMTNDLLKKNADTLKMATIETAKESERGIVDMETLTHTNQSLISTLDEVLKIQTEGKARREAAENELAKIEKELNEKLIEVRK